MAEGANEPGTQGESDGGGGNGGGAPPDAGPTFTLRIEGDRRDLLRRMAGAAVNLAPSLDRSAYFGLALVLALWGMVSILDSGVAGGVMPLAGAVAVWFGLADRRTSTFRLARTYARDPSMGAPVMYVLDPSGVHVRDDDYQSRLPWSHFALVRPHEGDLVLAGTGGMRIILLPHEAFADEAEVARAGAWIAHWLSHAAASVGQIPAASSDDEAAIPAAPSEEEAEIVAGADQDDPEVAAGAEADQDDPGADGEDTEAAAVQDETTLTLHVEGRRDEYVPRWADACLTVQPNGHRRSVVVGAAATVGMIVAFTIAWRSVVPGALLAVGIAALWFRWGSRRAVVRRWSQMLGRDPSVGAATTWVLSPSGLHRESAGASYQASWKRYTALKELDASLLLIPAGALRAEMLPPWAFTSDAHRHQIAASITTWIAEAHAITASTDL